MFSASKYIYIDSISIFYIYSILGNLEKSLRFQKYYLGVKVTFTEVIAKSMERSWPLQLGHL